MTTVGAAQVDEVSGLGDEATVTVDRADDGRYMITVVVRGAQFPGTTRQVSFSLVFTGAQVDHFADAVVKARMHAGLGVSSTVSEAIAEENARKKAGP